MNFIITESQKSKYVFKIIEDVFDKHHDGIKKIVSSGSYEKEMKFISNNTDTKNNNVLYSTNSWGMLWVDDCNSYEEIVNELKYITGDYDEIKSMIMDYFNKKYDLDLKDIIYEETCWEIEF